MFYAKQSNAYKNNDATSDDRQRYETWYRKYRWHVAERYNVARDVCDKHDPHKLAMILTGESLADRFV